MRTLIGVFAGTAICITLLLASNPGPMWRIRLWSASQDQETRLNVLHEVWRKAVEIDIKSDGPGLRRTTPVPQSVQDAVVSIGLEYLHSDDPVTAKMAIHILCNAGRKRKDVLPALIEFASQKNCDPDNLADLLGRLYTWEELAAPAKQVALSNLKHSKSEVRSAAVSLVYFTKSATDADIELIRPLIHDVDEKVQEFALITLHAYGKLDDEARAELEKHTKSTNFDLKKTARRLLKDPPKVTLPTK